MRDETWWVLNGDCRTVLADCPDSHVHAVITDPPYGLSREPKIEEVLSAWLNGDEYHHKGKKGFCGEAWDSFVPSPSYWKEIHRVLVPGGYLLSFAGTRTWDWMSLALRLAGFENRDTIADFIGPSAVAWVYGQGMGKSGRLKPAWEPILMFRKPTRLSDKAQMETTGTGKLNIDACKLTRHSDDVSGWHKTGADGSAGYVGTDTFRIRSMTAEEIVGRCGSARYPPNAVLTEDATDEMDRQSGYRLGGKHPAKRSGMGYMGSWKGTNSGVAMELDGGGASKFFPCFKYCPKATRKEKELGLQEAGIPIRFLHRVNPGGLEREKRFAPVEVRNNHKTVKPIALMRWLIKLVTQRGQIVLDPFMGSGTTGCATMLEGREFIGIDIDQKYCDIAAARIRYWETKELVDQECAA